MSVWIENLATAIATVVSLALALVAFRSWWKTRNAKILLLSLAFSVLALKTVALSIALFTTQEWEQMLLPVVLLDVVALLIFYAAILR